MGNGFVQYKCDGAVQTCFDQVERNDGRQQHGDNFFHGCAQENRCQYQIHQYHSACHNQRAYDEGDGCCFSCFISAVDVAGDQYTAASCEDVHDDADGAAACCADSHTLNDGYHYGQQETSHRTECKCTNEDRHVRRIIFQKKVLRGWWGNALLPPESERWRPAYPELWVFLHSVFFLPLLFLLRFPWFFFLHFLFRIFRLPPIFVTNFFSFGKRKSLKIFRLNKQNKGRAFSHPHEKRTKLLFFSHPDYTVGFGIAPNPAPKRSQTLLPIGNFTLPWRISYFIYKFIISAVKKLSRFFLRKYYQKNRLYFMQNNSFPQTIVHSEKKSPWTVMGLENA